MDLYLIANIITCVGAFAGFIYGAAKFFRPKKAVYAQMITFSAGCMAFGRLYQAIRVLTGSEIVNEFHLGVLGVIGTLMFFFSANFGLMDSIVDDGSPDLRKYRVFPAGASAVAVAVYLIFFFFTDQPLIVKVIALIGSCLIAFASYYNLKHFIIPDEFGIIRWLRPYNLLALIFEFLCLAEMVAQSRRMAGLVLVIGILMGVLMLMIVVAVDRGIKKWSI
ncbi:MAG: hypothetical protein IJU99_07380 [Lachnospiraceae bacterium]|nr:hypothetical protein [Lachnospiraceae bacterium]